MNQPATILIVDDLAANRETLSELLAANKYRILEAADGPTALRLAVEDPPDLVLLDVMMPNMDGYTVCRLLRADARLAEVPVIMVTALDDPASRLAGIQAGADDFITKPFNRAELRARVRTIIRLNRYRRLVDAQSALGESETRFRELAENIEDVFWLSDPEKHQKTYISPAYERIWGRTCQSAYDSPHAWIESIHPEDRDRVRRAAEAKRISGIYNEEFRILRPDGTERWVHDRSFPVNKPDGGVKCWAGVTRDITGSKQAEEALQKSAAEFRALAESMPQMVWITRADGWTIYFSQQWMDYTGLTLEESLGHGWNKPFHPEDQQRAWDAWQHATTTTGIYSIESRLRRADGAYRWWLIRGVPQLDPTGNILKWFGTCTDIHDLKVAELEISRANRELRESDEKFLQLAANVTDVFYITSPDLREIHYVSPAYEHIWGRTTQSLYADPRQWGEAILPAERAEVIAAFSRLAEGEPSLTAEFRIARPDGTIRWILSRGVLVRDATGRGIRITGIASDITERKQAEAKLVEQASLLDKARDAILVCDLEQRVTYWNKSAERLYGWSATEIIGQSVHKLSFNRTPALQTALQHVSATGAWMGELEQVAKDGRKLVIEGRWTLVRDEQDQPKAVLAINTDITDRKHLEAQFLRAQRMESIGTLAGGIAHDLNNVLAPIMMAVEFLRTKPPDTDANSALETLQTCSQRGADLVRQVLSFGRGVEGERIAVNAAHVFREIQKVARETFPKSILFRLSVVRDLWFVKGDPTQLHQVFLNLCINARDAMAEGGKLTVTMQNIVLDEVFASANLESKAGPYVLTEVTDTGPGIPAAIRDRIFEPFFTTKELGKGTGLGLSTTLTIVQSHGGFINLQSEPGKGAKFSVYLPADTDPNSVEIVPGEPPLLAQGNGELILIVDDESGVRNVSQKMLERFGYRTLLACHGAEGVALYTQHREQVAAVITDMAMPVMDGAKMIAAIKALNPAARIIVTTGLASGGSMQKAVDAGVKHFITKPYAAHVMLECLHQLLHDPSP